MGSTMPPFVAPAFMPIVLSQINAWDFMLWGGHNQPLVQRLGVRPPHILHQIAQLEVLLGCVRQLMRDVCIFQPGAMVQDGERVGYRLARRLECLVAHTAQLVV